MALSYVIQFQAGRFYVAPMGGAPGAGNALPPGSPVTPAYWAIVDERSRNAVAFAFEENAAKTVCFSLDLMSATLEGDKVKTRKLMRALESVAKTGPRGLTPV